MATSPKFARASSWRLGVLVVCSPGRASGSRSSFSSRCRRAIVIASGPTPACCTHAQRYVKLLAQHSDAGISERMTEGVGENLQLSAGLGHRHRLRPGAGRPTRRGDGRRMLASLYYQPLWIFTRRGETIDTLAAAQRQKVSTGMPGSGTNALALPPARRPTA